MLAPPYQAGRQRIVAARPDRPRLYRSRDDRLQPRGGRRGSEELPRRQGGHRVGRRLHPPVPRPLHALVVAEVPDRRELRHDARRRAVGLSAAASRHLSERHHARVVDPELPDRSTSSSATTCRTSSSCRPTPPPPGITRSSRRSSLPTSRRRCAEAERFAMGEYTLALMKGSTPDRRPSGRISPPSCRGSPGCRRSTSTRRTSASTSCASPRSCCATERQTAGRLDSRFTGIDARRGRRALRVRPEHGGHHGPVHRRHQRLRARAI